MTPPSLFGPTEKPGDAIIHTVDGAAFQIHFDILAFASPVFCSLLTPCTVSAYLINENSKTFALFAKLAYSRDVPVISSFDALDNALHVATKYELRIMKHLLRQLLSNPKSAVYLEKDPISAFDIASKYDLSDELPAVSRAVVHTVDWRDHDTVQLLKSSDGGMKILKMLALRHSKLVDTLLLRDRNLTIVEDLENLRPLACPNCFNVAQMNMMNYVSWTAHWAQQAHDVLLYSCVTKQDRLFSVGYILEMMSGPTSCLPCRCAIATNTGAYEVWIKGVRSRLQQHLTDNIAV
ncbi:hypothetical protein BDV93DRAFT_557104 [Ceratobasidium sp. AG-I]|nr:hypothetical protein BDV93DRAFT_557104 [Ceratobasidium sp. AG-I]